jgi:hypothetical protein
MTSTKPPDHGHRIRDDHGRQNDDFPSTSLHPRPTMTMAAGAKLFVYASSTGHQAISDERRRREKWQLKVSPGYWGRYNSPFI